MAVDQAIQRLGGVVSSSWAELIQPAARCPGSGGRWPGDRRRGRPGPARRAGLATAGRKFVSQLAGAGQGGGGLLAPAPATAESGSDWPAGWPARGSGASSSKRFKLSHPAGAPPPNAAGRHCGVSCHSDGRIGSGRGRPGRPGRVRRRRQQLDIKVSLAAQVPMPRPRLGAGAAPCCPPPRARALAWGRPGRC